MQIFKRLKSKPLQKKIILGVCIFFIVFTVTGFFILPPIFKSVLIKKLSENLHRGVEIKEIKVNPFKLSVNVKGFMVKNLNSSSPFISFDELYANLQSISIFKRGLIIGELRIEKPYIDIVRNTDGTYNFSDLIEKDKPSSKPFRFSINNIQILNCGVDFWDGPKNTRHKVREAEIKIPFLSNLPYYSDIFVQPSFKAKINDAIFSFSGKTKPFKDSLETILDVDINDFDIPYYLSYIPARLNFYIKSGYLDLNANISYTQYRDKHPTLNLKGTVNFKRIIVQDTNSKPLITFPLLGLSISSSDLMSKLVHFSKISLKSPEISLTKDKTGQINILSIFPNNFGIAQDKNSDIKKESGPSASINADEIFIADGRIVFSDLSNSRDFKTTLESISFKVDNFTTETNKKFGFDLSLNTENSEDLNLKGELSLSPLSISGELIAKQILLKKYSPYYRDKFLFDIDDGRFDLHTGFEVAKGMESYNIKLLNLEADLKSLMLRRNNEKDHFLRIPYARIEDTNVDLTKKKLVFGKLFTGNGDLAIKRFSDGTINILSLLPSETFKKEASNQSEMPKKEKPWIITFKKIAIDQYSVKAEDMLPAEPVTVSVEKIRFKVDNMSNAENSKGAVSFSANVAKKGSIVANGNFILNPLSAALKIVCKDIPITPIQPYFTDRIKIYVVDGVISTNGSLSIGHSKERKITASYKGEASLTNFSSIDKINAEDFLKWNSLYVNNIDARYNPFYLKIGEIALSDFYARIIINSDGTLNVQKAVVKDDESEKSLIEAEQNETAIAESKEKVETKKIIAIDKITIQGGTINFSDYYIKPNYSANLLEIGGRISGLSSEEDKMAEVNFMGKLEHYAPLEIKGKINPLKEDLYIELTANFKDMDMSSVTPYSGKYLGYTIQKGKLSFNLQYLIVKNKLDAQNNIFLDQFNLGEQVESPDATKLPVKLAIALLKNRKGEINLDIPVSGYIDDPKFSIGKIIIKILVNILVKAATSPFALLGAIFGGGEELSYIEFDYGSFDVPSDAEQKINTLINALYDRPSLRLEIQGHVDAEKDRDGLRQYFFNRKLKAQKLKDMMKRGITGISLDDVKIEPNEYHQYLKAAYKEEKFPKPRNILGMLKDLPSAEMEKLIMTHIEIKDDDLRQLASNRALKVKDYIIKSGKVESERIFLTEPHILQPERKEKVKDSRVDFRIK